MIDSKERQMIEGAIRTLSSGYDHCGDRECTMRARAAIKALEKVIDPVPATLHPARLTNPAERIYFERFAKQCKREPWLNSGYGLLEWILCPQGQDHPTERPTQRDAEVAGSVIQWLGTSCGHGFVEECERQIREERAEHSALEMELVKLRKAKAATVA